MHQRPRFLDDGRICLTNNAAERALRGVALGRKSWPFAGSDRGGERAAAMYSLVTTAKLNDVDPRAWLAGVLARIADHPASRPHELLPWNRRKPPADDATAAARPSTHPRPRPEWMPATAGPEETKIPRGSRSQALDRRQIRQDRPRLGQP
jgi:hypothetical protein